MAGHNPTVTLKCKNHYQKLTKCLWDQFLTKKGVDTEVEWAGFTVLAHRMVMEAFLSPDKLNRRAKIGWYWEEDNDCLEALLEFLYRGQVTVHHDQLDNLLEAARESDFQELVESLETVKGGKPVRAVKSHRQSPTPEPVAPQDEEDQDSDSDYDPQPDMGNDDSDGQSNDGIEVEVVQSEAEQVQQPSLHQPLRQLEHDLPAKRRKMDAAALVSQSEAEVTAVAAAVVAANQAAEIAAANATIPVATIPPEFAMLKRPRKKWTLHGDVPEVFACVDCDKKYTRPYHLDRHMRTHVQYRPHVCDLCQKTFTDKGNMVRHRRTHFNDRPHLCEQCNKGFSRAEQLATHSRSCGRTSARQRDCKRQQQLQQPANEEAVIHAAHEMVIMHNGEAQHFQGENQQYVGTVSIDLSSFGFQFQ